MKAARQLSMAILILLSLGTLFGGYHMVTDPTGSSLGLPFYLLNGSVFNNYYAVGWILLLTIGVLGLLIVLMIWRKSLYYSYFIMAEGVLICVFVIVAWLLIGESFAIEYVYFIAGLALTGLGVLQNQRKIAVESEKKAHYHPEPKSHHHKHRKHK